MPEIGISELKARAAEIFREVQEQHTRFTITHRGRPVGMLVPLSDQPADERKQEDSWEELIRLGNEISENWQSPLTSTEILSEMRR